MKTLALAVAVALAAPAVAHADSGGFVSLGVGSTLSVGGDLDAYRFEGQGLAGSLFVGQRFGRFGLEVGLSRYGLVRDGGNQWTNTALAAAGRFTLPIGPTFGGYLRAGLEKTWMSPDKNGEEFRGTGWLAGLGGEYRLQVGKVAGTVWAELTRHDASFVSPTVRRDGPIDLVTVGVSAHF